MPELTKKYFTLLCPSFHGATMLSALLSNHSSVCSTGDGNPGLIDPVRVPCKCGRKIEQCSFWNGLDQLRRETSDDASGLWFPTTPKLIEGRSTNLKLAKALAWSSFKTGRNLMALFPRASRRFNSGVEKYADYCRSYHSAKVFFDGEKSFAKYCSLQSSGFPIDGVVHFVRDPRAFAASAKKRNRSVEVSAAEWNTFHARLLNMASWGGRTPVMRLRYEDLVDAPEATLNAITSFMGLPSEPLARAPAIDTLHLIGNSLRGFDGIPRKGSGWKGVLTEGEGAQVAAICQPLMREFGY